MTFTLSSRLVRSGRSVAYEQPMVPFYQIAAHVLAAALLLLAVIYWPFVSRRPIPHWAEATMLLVGVIALGGAIFAMMVGHWPFRG